jgi:SAM-dependent methyltransferase
MPFGKATWFIPTLTWQPRPQAERVVAQFPASALIVDLGAGGRKIAPHVKTVDFVKFPGTDYVSDVTATPFKDGTVDLVIATGLLEHVEDDRKLIGEMRRILKPGGSAYIEIPFLQQYHDDPIDCRRLTQPGLALLLKQNGFEVVDSGTHIGPTVTLLTLGAYWLAMWFEGKTLVHKVLSNGVFAVASALFWPFKFLDGLLIKKPSAHRLAFGVYCTARKTAAST